MQNCFKGVVAFAAVTLLLIGTSWAQADLNEATTDEEVATIPTAVIAEQLTRDQLNALVSDLSEQEVLELLITHYEAVAAGADDEDSGGASVLTSSIDGLADGAAQFGSRMVFVLGFLSKLPDVWHFVEERLESDGGVLSVLLRAIGIVLLGMVAWWGTRRASAGLRRTIVTETRATAWGKISRLLARIGLDLTAIAAFAAVVGIAMMVLTEPESPTRLITVTYLLCALTLQVADAIARLLVAPQAPGLRIMRINNAAAASTYRWLMWIAGVATFGFLSCGLIAVMGLLGPPHVLLLLIVGSVVVLLASIGVVRARRAGAQMLVGYGSGGGSDMTRALARFWFVPVVLVFIGLYLAWLTHLFWTGEPAIGRIAASIGVLLAVPVVDYVLSLILFGPAPQRELKDESGDVTMLENQDAPPQQTGARPLRLSLRILVIFAGLMALAAIWGGDPLAWLRSEDSLGSACRNDPADSGAGICLLAVDQGHVGQQDCRIRPRRRG